MRTEGTVVGNGGNDIDKKSAKRATVMAMSGWLHGIPVLKLRRGF